MLHSVTFWGARNPRPTDCEYRQYPSLALSNSPFLSFPALQRHLSRTVSLGFRFPVHSDLYSVRSDENRERCVTAALARHVCRDRESRAGICDFPKGQVWRKETRDDERRQHGTRRWRRLIGNEWTVCRGQGCVDGNCGHRTSVSLESSPREDHETAKRTGGDFGEL